MLRSIRQGILACLLVLVGLAFWQAYRAPAQTSGTAPRIMTLDDNGEELKCRLVRLTLLDNGKRIYDLEVTSTGEKIRAEETVPMASSGTTPGRKVGALRILQRERAKASEAGSLHANVMQVNSPGTRRFVLFPNLRANSARRSMEYAPSESESDAAARVANRLHPIATDTTDEGTPEAIEAPRLEPFSNECGAMSRNQTVLPIVNRLSRIMPSGRPSMQDRPGPQPGPVSTAIVCAPQEPAQLSPIPAGNGILARLAAKANSDTARSIVPPPVPLGETKAGSEVARPQSVIYGSSPLAAMAGTPTKTTTKAPAKKADRLPAGSGSVLASKNGLPTSVAFVPVPIVTVPDPYRRPSSPVPMIPQPPQANLYVNGFTQPNRLPMTHHHMYPAVPMPPNSRQIAQVNSPHHYSGPMPPNPTMMMQQQHSPVMMQPAMAPENNWYPVPTHLQSPGSDSIMLPPAVRANPMPEPMRVDQLLSMLKDSPYPSQRELAAKMLCAHGTQPQIVTALVETAQRDPAASVRVGCVNSLASMSIPRNQLATALTALQNDSDPRVRQEVMQVLGRTNGDQQQVIQPVSQKQ